jgi:hypothetical protein
MFEISHDIIKKEVLLFLPGGLPPPSLAGQS